MKILSNFDTGLAETLQDEFIESFGEDKVIVVRKSKYYFYKFMGRPMIVFLILLMVSAYFLYTLPDLMVEIEILFWIIFFLYLLIILIRMSSKRVDYRMDFLIVTPREVIKYNQAWILSRDVEKIHSDKIKTISLSKHWFMQSLLNIWEITFLAEWDRDEWDIVMEYVDAVEHTEKKIRHVLGMDKE